MTAWTATTALALIPTDQPTSSPGELVLSITREVVECWLRGS